MMFQKSSTKELGMYVEKEHVISQKQKAAEESNFANEEDCMQKEGTVSCLNNRSKQILLKLV